MTTSRHPFYDPTTDNSHQTEVHFGGWNVFAYCLEVGCHWESPSTSPWNPNSFQHRRQGAAHTRKMNRWWRRALRRWFAR